MLTILNDPAGITGRRRIPWGAGTVFEHVARAMPDGGGDCTVRFNGAEIDPVRDPRMAAAPAPGDEVVVVQRPEGLQVWALVISLALAAYSYTLIPKPTDQPQTSQSSNNQLTGQTNVARAYQAIPDVYGLRRCWPDLIQPSLSEYVGNQKLITEWLCVSRGKGTITDVKFAETLLADVSGASWGGPSPGVPFEPAVGPSAYPELNDTTLTDVFEPFAAADVNGQELSVDPGTSSYFGDSILTTTNGSATFTLQLFGSSSTLDYLKSIAGTGTARVTTNPFGGLVDGVDEVCDVVSHVGNTFTFSRPSGNFSADQGPVNVVCTVTPTGAPGVVGPFTLPVDSERIWWHVAFLRGLVGSVEIEAEW